jgi:hypothetical protein
VPNPGPIEHAKLADLLDRSARQVVLAIIPIALIAVVDLSTGWLLDDRRMDIALLAITAMLIWSAYSFRRRAERLRSGDFGERPTRRKWLLELASLAALLAMCAGIGYLIGDWVPAIAFPAATIVLTAGAVAVGVRRGRRRRRLTAGR